MVTVGTLDLSWMDPFDADEPFQELYRSAIDASQTESDSLGKLFRYFILYQSALSSVRSDPNKDFVECGCWNGHSTYMLATILRENGFAGQFHVFDSFEGLSEFTEEDACEYYQTDDQKAFIRKVFASNEQKVRDLLSPFDFVRFYPGWIPTRFVEIEDREFSFISVDVDLYEPTFLALDHLFPRLIDGGMVYLDDYGSRPFPGARKAVDRYLADWPASRLLRMPFTSALIIKAQVTCANEAERRLVCLQTRVAASEASTRDTAVAARDSAAAELATVKAERDQALAARDAARVETANKNDSLCRIQDSIVWKVASPLWRLETRIERKARRAVK
jgi:O-methyltransferase